MPTRRCIGCRRIIPAGSRCAACTPRSPSSRATGNRAWRHLRARILARDGHACQRCGATAPLEIHHIVEVAAGGTNDPTNLLTLCFACHPRG